MSPSDRSDPSGAADPSGDLSDDAGSSDPSPLEPALGDDRPTSSRRAFLGRAAAGAAAGGLVWAAPSILTVDAAAAASCGTGGTINWANVTPANNPTSVTVGTVTGSIAHTDTNGVGSSPNFSVNTGTFGGQSAPWYQMQMEGAQTGNFMTVTFTFNTQVNNLTFQFFDIDQNTTLNGTGRYRDAVSVVGYNASNAVVGTTPSNLGSNITGSGTSASPFLPANGSNNIGNSSGASNARITFNGPVQTVTITYEARAPKQSNGTDYGYGGGNNGWSSQRIGIGNMQWDGCT